MKAGRNGSTIALQGERTRLREGQVDNSRSALLPEGPRESADTKHNKEHT